MRTDKLTIRFLVFCACFLVVTEVVFARESNVPVSREGTIEDYTNPAEILVHAYGMGKKTEEALLDARRAAIYVILLGGTDPLLQTPEEKQKFESVQESFYEESHMRDFISWEARAVQSRIRLPEDVLKISKHFKVNKAKLDQWLVENEVKVARQDLLAIPIVIMVIPDVEKGKNPIEAMNADLNLKHAGSVIRSYLTNRKYDVQVPEQMDVLQTISGSQDSLKALEEDYSYQLALAIGSDVYITYTAQVQNRTIADSTVRKAITSVKAYETTTARLLGEETGYSEERPSPDQVVIEEAINGAIDKVLSRINAYWKEDLQRGIQYQLIIRIEEGIFDEDDVEDIGFAMSDLLREFCNVAKEVIASDTTLAYQIWAKPDKYRQSRDLYRDLREQFPRAFAAGKITRINLNRKLIHLKITQAN